MIISLLVRIPVNTTEPRDPAPYVAASRLLHSVVNHGIAAMSTEVPPQWLGGASVDEASGIITVGGNSHDTDREKGL